jgi:arylsulfatase A-like enzyme
VFEGGIRVPFAVRWDGRFEAGQVVRHPVSTLDVLPTVLAAAGIDSGKDAAFDGVDLVPLLTGKTQKAPHEALFFRMGPQWAVRWKNWKLLEWEGTVGLYDLSRDVAEDRNLAKSRPEIVTKMRALYEEWEKGTVPAKWTRQDKRRGKRRKR